MAKCNTKLIRTFAENINVMDYTLNIKGRLLSLSAPVVMGILNCTPDSFFAGSRKQTEKEIADRANQIVAEGGSIIDVGAFSTRPGASEVSQEEEMNRLRHASLVAPARADAPREQRQYQHAALRVKHVAVEETKEAEVEPCLQLGVVHLQQPA